MAAFFVSQLPGVAFASSVGVINGTVTDAGSNAPLANVRVTAASPSGSYHATTDAHGFYTMTGVFANTYTVSFQLNGYQPQSSAGITVFADQTAVVNQQLSKSLKVIATAHARSSGSAFQPTQTIDTVSVNTQQILQFQGTTFNFNEAQLITSMPGAELDKSGYPVIHGGREYEEGFQFEGIPYVDAYSNQFTNALDIPTAGVASVQLTPGGGDITQTSGGFGALNVVAKRGTYPAYATAGIAIGGPAFTHRISLDYSWATPDGKISNYASFNGFNNSSEYGANQYPYAQIGAFYGRRLSAGREFTDNFVWRFGANNHESLQFFTDMDQANIYIGAGGFGNGLTRTSTLCYASCDPEYTGVWGSIFGMSTSQLQAISALYPGQASAKEFLSCPISASLQAAGYICDSSSRAPFTYWEPNNAYKLQYTNNLNESTYLSLAAYRVNSVTTFDGPSTEGSYTGDAYLPSQGGFTNGVTLSLQKQLSSKNLLRAGADISHLTPVDSYTSVSYGLFASYLGALNGFFDQYALPYAFIKNSDPNCPIGPGTPDVSCGWAYQGPYANAAQLTLPKFDQVASVPRQDYSVYLSDKWTPNDKWNIEGGVRLDMATYRAPTPGIDPYYCVSRYYIPATWTAPTAANWDPANGKFNCDAKATFNVDNSMLKPKVPQPQLGISYRMGQNTSLRLTYRRAVQFVPIGTFDFGDVDQRGYESRFGMLGTYDPFGAGTNCGYAGTALDGNPMTVACRDFGEQLYWANQNFDGPAIQPVRPTTSDNYQFTISHQFTSGLLNGVAVSLSPWYRNQHDTIAAESSPIIQNGQPVIVNGQFIFGPQITTNNGKEHATGIDFNLTREVAYGLSAQLTATYINEFSSVIPLSGSEDFYPTIDPASVALGNVYRVGFLSPFQSTLALSYRTHSGWRINPRYTYDIGYPTGQGLLTSAFVNNTPFNVPNTNAVAGSAPAGPACFVDPMNPGSVFSPNEVGCRGFNEAASPGGKLSPPDGRLGITLEYSPPTSKLTYGVDVENVFNEVYGGSLFNSRYEPIATGVGGPLTGWSTSGVNYIGGSTYPSAWPHYGSMIKTNGPFVTIPNGAGRTFYFYIQTRL
jgi:hypothetical protein